MSDEFTNRREIQLLEYLAECSTKQFHLLTKWYEEWVAANIITHQAVRAVLTLSNQGDQMPGTITVDTTNETVTLGFVDDKGDTNAAPPVAASGASLVVTFASDNTAVATVAVDASSSVVGDITPVAEGTANISATLAYTDGSPVLEADGVTAFPAPAAVAVTVGPGAAVGDALTLSV